MTQPPELDWTDLDTDETPEETLWPTTETASTAPAADVVSTSSNPPTVPVSSWPMTEAGGVKDPDCQARRELVLRHPEIAKRLCEYPVNYSRPEVWQGYVPPEMWRERINDSPQRVALLAIIEAAEKAEQGAAE